MKNIFRSLNQIYYLIYTLIILLTILGYFLNMNNLLSVDIGKSTGIVFLSVQVLITVFAVVYFGFFLYRVTKLKANINEKNKEAIYHNIANIRLYLIGVSLLAGVLCLYLVRSEIVLYQIAISAVLLILSKPKESIIDDILTEN